jgi:hypothetical protein
VQYLEIIPLLLQERREQQAKIARLGALVEQLAAEVAELRRTRLADNAARKN